MSERFAVGEIAVIVNCILFPEYNGEDCKITSGLMYSQCWADRAHTETQYRWGYKAETSDGLLFLFSPEQIRKKRPPDKRASWDRIEELTKWNPQKVTAS